ncbi:cytochrome P450 76T24-like [Tripterygium wilfordii]|uniref:cytochrome P450 76T24-like n=1 Tax=Tripterygium wilfordii TaxID=458696 RepID=UPI0018F7FDEC|nr:cytochrome P450 76T24-like [Tripterygium wilfordii]
MDYFLLLVLILSFAWTCFHVFTTGLPGRRKSSPAMLPPGPRPLPIVGNIFNLGNKPHQALADLSQTYGPIMTLKLGGITTIVMSSPYTAKEVLHKHDRALSARTIPGAVHAKDHHMNSIVWLPPAAHWKNLRKVSAMYMFTAQRLDASQALRRKKVQELLDYVLESCSKGQAVNIGQVAFTTSLNLISNTFFSIDLSHYHSEFSQSFSDITRGVLEDVGRPNFADYFTILRVIDPQGCQKRVKNYFEMLFHIFDGIIDKRTHPSDVSNMSTTGSRDLLDSLLDLAKDYNSEFSLLDLKHMLLDLFVAGTDTTSSTLEWAMAELLCNPEKLTKAQTELRKVIGKDEIVEESKITELPYLRAVVKETLRLHPPGPFLVPRKANSDVEICGFRVPESAQILVNVWAMGRDPNVWENPNSFVPERFLEVNIDIKGRDFELLPFGGGRRICPGMPLAVRMLHLTLASLLHSFDWKLADGLKPEKLDMSEKFGIALQKALPLLAVPIQV